MARVEHRVQRISRRLQPGFTLIEAMIVLATLTIILALAIPAYNRYITRANRAEAIEALLATAACQERQFIRNNAYDASACEGNTNNNLYSVTVETSNGNQNFVASATPQGAQSADNCGVLSLDDRGIKRAAGVTGAFAVDCWAGRFATSSS